MDNYRPTSILQTVSKLLKRTVHVQPCDHLRDHNILSPYQCGFRKQHSTEFAALSLADTKKDVTMIKVKFYRLPQGL